ncbi:TPA: FecCD family ABC transporter permease, partial [Streptococcus pneumoniae]
GFIFQTMLRNPLASPDIIGVTSSSSIAAVFCILVLKTNSLTTGIISITCGLTSSLILFLLAKKDGFSAARLIILGIGFQAVTRAGTSFLLLKVARYELQEVMRWLSGSLSFTKLDDIPLVLIVSIIATILVLFFNKRLEIIELGEEIAIGLGANPELSRLVLIFCAVSLTAFSTSITGPIACISFLAGPIALNIGKKRSPILA